MIDREKNMGSYGSNMPPFIVSHVKVVTKRIYSWPYFCITICYVDKAHI